VSFFTALGNYMGARGQATQRVRAADQQNEYNYADLAERRRYDEGSLEAQRAQTEATRARAAQDKIASDAALRGQGIGPDGQPLAPLPVVPPPVGAKGAAATDDQLVRFYLGRAAQAIQINRPDLAKQFTDLASQYGLGAQRTALASLSGIRGQEIIKGKIPLEQAQAGWWKQKHSEVMATLQNRLATVSAQVRGRANAAAASARARLSSSGMAADQKEFIALQTGLNVANGRNETEAHTEAMAQYHTAASQWLAQSKSYAAGTGPDPGAAPTPQQFTVNLPSQGSPSVVVVTVPMPDGTVRKIPMVQPHGNQPRHVAPTVVPIAQEIAAAHAHGVTDPNVIRSVLLQHGHSQAEIDRALPAAQAQPNVFQQGAQGLLRSLHLLPPLPVPTAAPARR